MESVMLCEYSNTRISIRLMACLEDGMLSLEGQDIGSTVNSLTGNLENKYIYALSREDTRLLDRLLRCEADSNTSFLALVAERFSGLLGCSNFRNFCDRSEIHYQFHTC